ncbi:TPA: hypothetical protein PXO57_000810 [Yersinia enterocolitica]|uniref:Uncharacterized protein n=1 Tax=Yersinia enterocolitica TaxID=630 RepID=A0A9P1PTZ2_YEREN|nr:hypothetical protein [Yersinia enterocolitica]EKN3442113.1 hypothetical protein [Yersinia enterocolitica]EKN3513910.1 hypothetical protein [Yersinia enterocolitica]EKN4795326.1 hypothetical protein [Yersinia enterocolitica]EKN4935785.1 hypothetical protein [Yersinia enterocolitica]EKN5051838.1 hypothetical protein [Yersinia enterocolitica]
MKKKFLLTMNGEDVTDSIRTSVSQLGLSPDIMNRCSIFLILQLHATVMSGMENPFKAIRELNLLENDPTTSRTKPPTMYSGKYLKNLWHKHYEGTGIQSLMTNLRNQFKLNQKNLGSGLPKLAAEIAENEKAGMKKYFEPEDAYKIANEFTITNFQRRVEEKKITGHWIIYANYNKKNYYLCLAKHSDDDKEIRQRIDSICLQEFPFLKGILSSL